MTAMTLPLNSVPGRHPGLVVMLHSPHLGYQIGPPDQTFRCSAPGTDHLHSPRPPIQNRVENGFFQQAAGKCDINLIQNQDIGSGFREKAVNFPQALARFGDVLAGYGAAKDESTAELTHRHPYLQQRFDFRIQLVFDELDKMHLEIGPLALRARPKAAVDLPLPSPVYTWR